MEVKVKEFDYVSVLYCDYFGDIRFTDAGAMVEVDGKKYSIHFIYHMVKRTKSGSRIEDVNDDFEYIQWKGRRFDKSCLSSLYYELWKKYFKQNPDLLEYLKRFDIVMDRRADLSLPEHLAVLERLKEEGDKIWN